MSQFLQIVGGLVICGFVAAILGFFALKWWLKRKFLAPLGEMMAEAAARSDFALSPEMQLNPIEAVWRDEERIEAMGRDLEQLGYTALGEFETVGLPVLLRAYHHENNSFAVVYEHAMTEPWTDFWTQFQGQTSLTVTNAPAGEEIETPPWSTKITLKGGSISALASRFEQEALGKPPMPTTPDDFARLFCHAYDRTIRWRAETGGVRPSEIDYHDPGLDEDQRLAIAEQLSAENESLLREIQRRDRLKGADGE